jgi:hypothetical protein
MKNLFLHSKHLAIIALSILFMQACNNPQQNGFFGQTFELDNAVPIDQVIAEMGDKDELEVIVSGKINKVCKHKGCWVTLETASGESVYINVVDEAFSLPESVINKNAKAIGKAYSIAAQKASEIEAGSDEDELDWITNISVEATGIWVE